MWKSWKRSASILFFSPIVGVVGCGRAPLDRVSGAESRDVGAVELASVPADQSLFDIAVDATGVYFAVAWYPEKLSGSAPGSDTAGAVRRVPREGGDTTELWRGQGAAYGVGAGESAIYFITYEYRSNGRAGHVWAVPRTGGTARALGGWGSQGSSIGFAVDGDAVYWGHSAGSGGALNRTDGVDGTTVAVVPEVSSPVGVATDGHTVFFVAGHLAAGGGVFGVPAAGGPPATILEGQGGDRGWLAVDPTSRTLLASMDDRGVVAIDLSGGRVSVLTDAPAGDVATDGTFAYWIDVGGGRIVKAAVNGCSGRCVPITVASGLSKPVAIAVDDRSVYWVDQDAHRVMRAPK